MEKLLTTSELAEAIGASESSMRRWTNSGVIRTARTAGGHRRIALSEAIRFVRESGATVLRPELLGLPGLPSTQQGKTLGSRSLERQLFEMLRAGDAAAASGCITSLFLNGLSVASICDGAIQEAMQRIGELWREDPRGILVEHRAMDISLHAVSGLKQMIGHPAPNAPIALGAAPEGDPYLLPSMMAGAVLAEAGYRDINFGPETPPELLARAAEDNKARLVWLSVKSVADQNKLAQKSCACRIAQNTGNPFRRRRPWRRGAEHPYLQEPARHAVHDRTGSLRPRIGRRPAGRIWRAGNSRAETTRQLTGFFQFRRAPKRRASWPTAALVWSISQYFIFLEKCAYDA